MLCSVYKSSKNIYAQMIDDVTGKTIVSASTLQDKVSSKGISSLSKPKSTIIFDQSTPILFRDFGKEPFIDVETINRDLPIFSIWSLNKLFEE